MTYKTHVAFASVLSLPVAVALYEMDSIEMIMFMLSMVIGSLAPDLDEKGSYLSRKIPIFPMIFELFGVKHREITHRLISVVFVSLFFLGVYVLEPASIMYLPAFIGFTLGYFLHLCGDMLTKGGINNFFYPFFGAKGILLPRNLRFYTGSAMEFIVFSFVSVILAIEVMYFTGVING